LLAGCKVISVYIFMDLCCNTTTYEEQLSIQQSINIGDR
jgi:hypothetical protein